MTRGDARELAVHLIYSREFTGEAPDTLVKARLEQEYYSNLAHENEIYGERPSGRQVKYLDNVVSGVTEHYDELNAIIAKYSIGWDIKRISRLTRAVMQLAIFEILYVDDVPDGVAVSEAVRLAKKYDADAGAFVNGILGTFVRNKDVPVEIPAQDTESDSVVDTVESIDTTEPAEEAVAEEV